MQLQVSRHEYDLIQVGLILLQAHLAHVPVDQDDIAEMTAILLRSGKTDSLTLLNVSEFSDRLANQANLQ
jgi:hypothetical protein